MESENLYSTNEAEIRNNWHSVPLWKIGDVENSGELERTIPPGERHQRPKRLQGAEAAIDTDVKVRS